MSAMLSHSLCSKFPWNFCWQNSMYKLFTNTRHWTIKRIGWTVYSLWAEYIGRYLYTLFLITKQFNQSFLLAKFYLPKFALLIPDHRRTSWTCLPTCSSSRTTFCSRRCRCRPLTTTTSTPSRSSWLCRRHHHVSSCKNKSIIFAQTSRAR